MLRRLWLAALVYCIASDEIQADQQTKVHENHQSIRHAAAYEFIFELLAEDIRELEKKE